MSETAGKEYQRWTLLFSALALLVSGLSIYFSVTTQEEMARVPYQTQVTVGVGCAVSTSAGTGKTVKYLTFDITNTGHAAFELSRIAIKEHGADTEKASFCPNQSYSSSSEFPNDTTAMDLKILEPGEHISYWYMVSDDVVFNLNDISNYDWYIVDSFQRLHKLAMPTQSSVTAFLNGSDAFSATQQLPTVDYETYSISPPTSQ